MIHDARKLHSSCILYPDLFSFVPIRYEISKLQPSRKKNHSSRKREIQSIAYVQVIKKIFHLERSKYFLPLHLYSSIVCGSRISSGRIWKRAKRNLIHKVRLIKKGKKAIFQNSSQ